MGETITAQRDALSEKIVARLGGVEGVASYIADLIAAGKGEKPVFSGTIDYDIYNFGGSLPNRIFGFESAEAVQSQLASMALNVMNYEEYGPKIAMDVPEDSPGFATEFAFSVLALVEDQLGQDVASELLDAVST